MKLIAHTTQLPNGRLTVRFEGFNQLKHTFRDGKTLEAYVLRVARMIGADTVEQKFDSSVDFHFER